ncbi:MAG: Gfo/Idh/MocA family oxidoreductase [Planctomycetota bacterium]
MSVRVGFVGYGGIAKAHQQSVVLSGMGKIVGGMDIELKQRQRFEEEAKAPSFTCFKEMLDKAEPEAVIVSTPPNVRLEIVRECAERGIGVLCEKPLAHNVESARELAAISKGAKNICAVAFCHRFNPGINRMKQLFEDGVLGEPIEFVNFFVGSSSWCGEVWRTDINISGGGCLMDNGSHSIDIFQYLFGRVEKAAGATRNVWPGRGDDTACLLVTSESGVIGQITVSWMYPFGAATVEVIGSKGAAKFDYSVIDELKIRIGKDEWKTEKITKDTRFVDQMKAFLSAVGGNQNGQLASFEDGLTAVEIIGKIYKDRL